jgi:hypothetical protein
MPSLTSLSSIIYYGILVVLALYLGNTIYDPSSKTNNAVEETAKMAELKVGDAFPSDIKFSYIPYTPEAGEITSCGIPINYDASKGISTPLFCRFSLCSCQASGLSWQTCATGDKADSNLLSRMGQQESRPLLRPWCLHPRLLCQAPPRLHREPVDLEGQGC